MEYNQRKEEKMDRIMRNNEWIPTIIEGKAGVGRPRTPFIKQIIQDIRKSTYKEMKVAVMDRDEWMATIVIEPT